jgi:fimbrial isopeptide formation D2 family protein/uncharacterized repeat protein (TIGR01451 family)
MKMKKQNLTFAVMLLLLIPVFGFAASVTSITGITLNPPAPAGGASIQVNWTYTDSDIYNNPDALILVSTQPTIQSAGTSGQYLMIGDGCSTPGDPSTGQATSGGCAVGSHSGTAGPYAAGPYTFNLPAQTADGGTFYIIVAMRDYGAYLNSGPQIDQQASVPIVIPLPPASCSLTKTAEATTVQPGDKVLYTVNYNYINAHAVTVTDVVPPNCTLISQSQGGTNSGTTAGSTLTWVLGDATTRITGQLWYIVQVSASAPPSTVIDNTAHYSMTENPAGGDSNDAIVTTGLPFTLLKSQNPASPYDGTIGDNITYSFDFHAGGMAFDTFAPFDADVSGFTAVSNGGPGYPGTWSWVSDGSGGGYLSSPQQGTGPTNDHYPHYLSNAVSGFCFGEIQADVSIGNGSTNWDGMITFRDNGVADGIISYGIGLSQDATPGHLFLQKSTPAYTPLTAANPIGISFDTWYTVKILVTDAGNGAVRIQARVWQKGGTEPSVWHIDYTDNSGVIPPCGKVGFQGAPFNPDRYDNLKVFQSSQTNPRLFDTIPDGITYVGGTAADTTHTAPILAGGMVKWNIFTSLTDVIYHFDWWGTINYCGTLLNQGSFDTDEVSPQIDSNAVTINVAVCPETYTFTPTYTSTPTFTPTFTPTYTRTFTPTYTMTPTYTRTSTMTYTPTPSYTPIVPVLVLTKTVNNLLSTSAAIGDTVTYNIHITSTNMAAAASNVVVWDTLPNKHTYLTCGGSGLVTCSEDPVSSVITWNLSNLASSALGTGGADFWFTATINSDANNGDSYFNTGFGNCNSPSFSSVSSNMVSVAANVPVLDLTKVGNFPNPFDGVTTIRFDLTVQAPCTLKVFTISGEKIKTMEWPEFKSNLSNGLQPATQGSASNTKPGTNFVIWDGTNNSGKKVASGVYIYRIEATRGNEKKSVISRLAVVR